MHDLMKRADLEKRQSKKIEGRMKHEATPDRYGSAAAAPGDRRDQREREKAAGLVPFAVKLPQDLVSALQNQARARGTGLNELVAELLSRGVGDER
jgi:hypothetical protein